MLLPIITLTFPVIVDSVLVRENGSAKRCILAYFTNCLLVIFFHELEIINREQLNFLGQGLTPQNKGISLDS